MKGFTLLLLLFALINGYTSIKYYSLADTFQSVLDTESALEEELKTNYENARAAREQYREELKQKMNDKLTALQNIVQQKADELQKAADEEKAQKKAKAEEVLNKWKEAANEFKTVFDQIQEKKEAKREEKQQKIQEFINEMKAKYEQRQQEKETERQQKIEQWKQVSEQLRQKRDEIKQQVQEAKQKWDEQRKQKLEELKADLKQVKDLVTAEVQRRMEAKKQRAADQEANIQSMKDAIKQGVTDLETQAGSVGQQVGAYAEKKEELTQMIRDMLNQGVKDKISNKVSDDLQAKLDKAALKEVLSENRKENAVAAVAGEAPVEIAQKATFLDEITGKAAWETVTWVLLALCILLSVALIIMIVCQVKQRHYYERLDGHDHESQPVYSERQPLLPPAATPSTAPPLSRTKEEQQF